MAPKTGSAIWISCRSRGTADSPALWIVHNYQVVKGGGDFAAQLARPRVSRGKAGPRTGFLVIAADMVVSLEKRAHGLLTGDDLLDPRRRLEQTRGELARVLHQCLFNPPDRGVQRLAEYLSVRYGESIGAEEARALHHLLGATGRPRCAEG